MPAGPFKMGSENGYDNERPVREVTLDAYCIAKHEIRHDLYAQYEAAISGSQNKFELVQVDCSGSESVVDTRATRDELAVSPFNISPDHRKICGVHSRPIPVASQNGEPSPKGFDAPDKKKSDGVNSTASFPSTPALFSSPDLTR